MDDWRCCATCGVENDLDIADIGQTALLVRTPAGNLLWAVPGYIDAETVEQVARLGGIAAIMTSHPHMYGVQLEWAAAPRGAASCSAATRSAPCRRSGG